MSKIDKKNRFYYDSSFLGSTEGRSLRILSEYYGPLQKLERNNVSETIVFFGSAEKSVSNLAPLSLPRASLPLQGCYFIPMATNCRSNIGLLSIGL